MDRRKALKDLGLTFGYIVATPSVLSLLQSCKDKPTLLWNPQFYTKEESIVLENLVNLILPKTNNLPGALEVNVPQFLDLYQKKAANKEEQELHKKGMDAIIKSFNTPIRNLKKENYDALLAKYLKADENEIKKFNKNNVDLLILKTLTNLRTHIIWAYKTSQKVGEEVLAYDPIPGKQLGCIPLQDATGGKAWSL